MAVLVDHHTTILCKPGLTYRDKVAPTGWSHLQILSIYYMPVTVLGLRDRVMNKIDKYPCTHGACILAGKDRQIK